jgi:hypothetical protein
MHSPLQRESGGESECLIKLQHIKVLQHYAQFELFIKMLVPPDLATRVVLRLSEAVPTLRA